MKKSMRGCWEWKRAKSGNGYGVMSFYKKNEYVHRISYRMFVGEIPSGKFVLHSCDNPKCFNPKHLFVGTAMDNVQDMIRKGRMVVVSAYGEKNPNCKFSDDQVLAIRKMKQDGFRKSEIMAAYNISASQCWRITSNKTRSM